MPRKFFLLSPANLAGVRGNYLTRDQASSALAQSLRGGGASLAEVFTFISSLYFRGKLAYVRAFSRDSEFFVITGCGGLMSPHTIVKLEELKRLTSVDFDPADERYRGPLHRDARALLSSSPDCQAVLLGSIASEKYVSPLLEIFGERLLFPEDFIGRGDMSRGGLMLRAAESGVELNYIPVATAQRRGQRPPKLTPKPRKLARSV